jgi:PAS domain S-box-containing protein
VDDAIASSESIDERDRGETRAASPSVDMLCVLGAAGELRRTYPAFERMLGYTAGDVGSRRLVDLLHPDDRTPALAALARLASGVEAACVESRCRHKDGSYSWVVWLLTRPPGADSIYAAAHDITARAHALAGVTAELEHETSVLREQAYELEAHRNSLQRILLLNQALLDASIDGIRLVDVDGRTILANSVIDHLTTQVFGLPRETTLPERSAIAARLSDPDAYLATIEKIARDPECETEDVFEVADLARTFQRHTRPVRDPSGELIGRVVIVREITAEREAERLRTAARVKSELVATVSHELRTPLTAVLGFAELMLDHDIDSATRQQYLTTIHGEAQRLKALVDDFLDLRKIESGSFQLALERFDLGEQLKSDAELFAMQSASHVVQVDAPDHLEIEGDRNRIAQVIGNLLSNAIKYSPEGGVVELGATSASGHIRVYVRDSGIGIPAEQQAQIFTEFFRVESSDTREIDGTGLGLSVCQEIVTAHGGRMGVESTEGEGSTFWFELPSAGTLAQAA